MIPVHREDCGRLFAIFTTFISQGSFASFFYYCKRSDRRISCCSCVLSKSDEVGSTTVYSAISFFELYIYRRYDKATDDSLTGLLQECFQMFKSEPMFKLLTTFTGLKLSNVDVAEQGEERDDDENKEETADEEKVRVSDTATFKIKISTEKLLGVATVQCHKIVSEYTRMKFGL